jgi:hypothetical protein
VLKDLMRTCALTLCCAAACGSDRIATQSRQRAHGNITSVPALRDCTYTFVSTPGTMPDLHVVRCPASSTSVNWVERRGKYAIPHVVTTTDEADVQDR